MCGRGNPKSALGLMVKRYAARQSPHNKRCASGRKKEAGTASCSLRENRAQTLVANRAGVRKGMEVPCRAQVLHRVAKGAGVIYPGEKKARVDLMSLYNCLK